jgi:hypothetical protein
MADGCSASQVPWSDGVSDLESPVEAADVPEAAAVRDGGDATSVVAWVEQLFSCVLESHTSQMDGDGFMLALERLCR